MQLFTPLFLAATAAVVAAKGKCSGKPTSSFPTPSVTSSSSSTSTSTSTSVTPTATPDYETVHVTIETREPSGQHKNITTVAFNWLDGFSDQSVLGAVSSLYEVSGPGIYFFCFARAPDGTPYSDDAFWYGVPFHVPGGRNVPVSSIYCNLE